MRHLRPISWFTDAAVGVVSAAPFAMVVLAVFVWGFPAFAWPIATACVVSGGVTGATVGRRVAARPTGVRIAGAGALAVLLGIPVGVVGYTMLWSTPYDFVSLALAGLVVYGLPAYILLGLPAFGLGLAITRRLYAASMPNNPG
jgi:hypothetical protein